MAKKACLAEVPWSSTPADAQPHQPLAITKEGVVRFKANAVVRLLLDASSEGRKLDLNFLWLLQRSGSFTIEDMEQFYQLIGYSVGGFCEISGFRDETKDAAHAAAQTLLKAVVKTLEKK